MSFTLQFLGATSEVTASLYAIRAGGHTVLLECGLIQGGGEISATARIAEHGQMVEI